MVRWRRPGREAFDTRNKHRYGPGYWYTVLSAILLCLLPAIGHADDTREAELQVRAQFVYNFANFVEWPDEAFSAPNAPIRICLFGDVAFAPYLNAFAGTLIGRRPLQVDRTNELNQIRTGCHVLYVGNDQRVRLPTFWEKIQYLYVLSVGERNEFADKGGIINILRTRDRLRFEINIENALSNGLFLDSDLLALARTIKRNTQ